MYSNLCCKCILYVYLSQTASKGVKELWASVTPADKCRGGVWMTKMHFLISRDVNSCATTKTHVADRNWKKLPNLRRDNDVTGRKEMCWGHVSTVTVLHKRRGFHTHVPPLPTPVLSYFYSSFHCQGFIGILYISYRSTNHFDQMNLFWALQPRDSLVITMRLVTTYEWHYIYHFRQISEFELLLYCTISSVLAVEYVRNPDVLARYAILSWPNMSEIIWTLRFASLSFRCASTFTQSSPQVHCLHTR